MPPTAASATAKPSATSSPPSPTSFFPPGPSTGDGDTIVALATSPAPSAVAVVRVSGPLALRLVAGLFRPGSGKRWSAKSHSVSYGALFSSSSSSGKADGAQGGVIDEVLVITMRGPRSYTREDVVEVHAHGGPTCAPRVLEALLLAFARRLPFMQAAMRSGDWSARQHPGVHRIAGRTLGLIGFGASAQAVARRAAAFGLQLLAWTRSPANYSRVAAELGVDMVSLDELLVRSDFASIHLPLNGETRHLLGAAQLARMMPTAALINTSRGAIVDEAALIDTLQRRAIAGAALDVFETIDVFALPGAAVAHPLLELDNVLATPHTAGSSVESTRESKVRGAQHAASVLRGEWPAHIVNPQVVPRIPLRACDSRSTGTTPGRPHP